jgi:serine/threonine protein kinase
LANPDPDRTALQTGLQGSGSYPAQPYANALPSGTRLGEFELLSVVGAGGFGIVYLAHDLALQRQVAIKEYMPASLAERTPAFTVSVRSQRDAETFEAGLRSFVNEARLLARFDHPSLLKVYRFWEANGTAYMVMPYYAGITLAQHLKQATRPPDEAWLRALLAQLLQVLEVLHAAQCLHRDIAPDNVLVLPVGRPLLLDFGAARRVISNRKRDLTVIFKPGYAPVEQYGGHAELRQGPWTDLYALASVAYLAITGHKPPPAVQRLLIDRYEPLARVAAGLYNPGFLQALDRALALMPQDRPQTAAELRAMLEASSQPTTVQGAATAAAWAPTPTTAPAPAPARPSAPVAEPAPRSRRTLRAACAVAALALAAAAAYWLMDQEGTREPPHPATTVPPLPIEPQPTPAPATSLPEPVPAPSIEPSAPQPYPPAPEPSPPVPWAVPTAPLPELPHQSPQPAAPPVQAPRPQKPPPPALVPGPTERAEARAPKERPAKVTPSENPTPAPRGLSARCADVIQRVTLGEPLTPDEREFLKQECRP